jgi:hypothetical protein
MQALPSMLRNSVSFYLARACLSAVIRLIGGAETRREIEVDVLHKLLREGKTMAIQQTEKQTKCAHPACQCTVATDEPYCSQLCQDAGGDEIEISSDCGHRGCAL